MKALKALPRGLLRLAITILLLPLELVAIILMMGGDPRLFYWIMDLLPDFDEPEMRDEP